MHGDDGRTTFGFGPQACEMGCSAGHNGQRSVPLLLVDFGPAAAIAPVFLFGPETTSAARTPLESNRSLISIRRCTSSRGGLTDGHVDVSNCGDYCRLDGAGGFDNVQTSHHRREVRQDSCLCFSLRISHAIRWSRDIRAHGALKEDRILPVLSYHGGPREEPLCRRSLVPGGGALSEQSGAERAGLFHLPYGLHDVWKLQSQAPRTEACLCPVSWEGARQDRAVLALQ